jgi:DNA anti-recombination protein RmuC
MPTSLTTSNERICAFYQANPQYDFDTMNLCMIDFLEKFQETQTPSMDTNFAEKMLRKLDDFQKDWLIQYNHQQYTQLQNTVNLKDHYMEEMKTSLKRSHEDVLLPQMAAQWQTWQAQDTSHQIELMKSTIQREIDTLTSKSLNSQNLQDCAAKIEERIAILMQATETRLQTQLKESVQQIEQLKKLGYDQEQMHTQVNELLRKMDNSSSKGKVSETILGHVIHNLYPMGDIRAVGTTKETGDIMMLRDNHPTILFENKNYDRNVGQEEVQKFLRDVETQKCCGILLAQNYGIAHRNNYEIHIYQGQICIYLHSVQYSPEKIKAAVDIIDHLYPQLSQINTKQQSEDIVIEYPFLEELNKEYQQFVQQKLNQMKTVKDYSQKMLTQIDEMKMPQWSQWLEKYFSQSLSSKETQCSYCGFTAKSTNGLTAHLRACKKRKLAHPSEENNNTINRIHNDTPPIIQIMTAAKEMHK